jgi:hypothetical protein
MMTGGRELSRQQLSHFNESLFSRVEDETIRIPDIGTSTGEVSQEPSHTDAASLFMSSQEPSHTDDASLFMTVEEEETTTTTTTTTTPIPDGDSKREASKEQSHAHDAPDK